MEDLHLLWRWQILVRGSTHYIVTSVSMLWVKPLLVITTINISKLWYSLSTRTSFVAPGGEPIVETVLLRPSVLAVVLKVSYHIVLNGQCVYVGSLLSLSRTVWSIYDVCWPARRSFETLLSEESGRILSWNNTGVRIVLWCFCMCYTQPTKWTIIQQ